MSEKVIQTDAVIAGLGLGAIAAALAIADTGRHVVMAGPETRIGGQVTTQLTSPLDEHPLIETTGCTARYRMFRDAVRSEYDGVENPGGGWVSRICFEPLVGERVLERMLAPHTDAGTITVIRGATPTAIDRVGNRVTAVRFSTSDGDLIIRGDVTIDATETGDLLPLAGADWVIGSEGRNAFGEPHALPGGPQPLAEQSCTVVAALVLDDAAGGVGQEPAEYSALRDRQPFSFTLSNDAGSHHHYAMFDDSRAPGSFWSYRRVRDPRQVGGSEAAIINWHGNDYLGSGLVADRAATVASARELAAAFVHWLRTEAPRDGGGTGHPELRLAPEVSGTADGFAESPYVRESRRLRSRTPVTEHDLLPRSGNARALAFADTIGTAWYHADLHPRVGGHPSVYAPTAPFQVPLSALVADPGTGPVNLIAGAKNLAATQVAAAAYRVHPGEWAVGEAAGILAVHALRLDIEPAVAVADSRHRVMLQAAALHAGMPIFWATDLPREHEGFVAGSLLAAHGGLDGARRATLELAPDSPLDDPAEMTLSIAAAKLANEMGSKVRFAPRPLASTWADRAIQLAAPILAALDESPSQTWSDRAARVASTARTRLTDADIE